MGNDRVRMMPGMPGEKHVPGQLLELRRRHDQIIQMHVIGLRNKEIAQALGITERTIQTTLYSDLGKARVVELRDLADIDTADIATQIHIGATRAVKFLNDVVEGVGEGVGASKGLRFKAAIECLRMDGFTPVSRSININATGVVGAEGMKALLEKGRSVDRFEVKQVEPIDADFNELIPEGT